MRNRCQRNNSPVNLRFAHQKEANGVDGDGFAQFPTPEAGWRAAHAQIELDKSRDLTLREFISKFAPPNENDTASYLLFIMHNLHCSGESSLKDISTYGLAGIMAKIEGYFEKETNVT